MGTLPDYQPRTYAVYNQLLNEIYAHIRQAAAIYIGGVPLFDQDYPA